MKKVSAFTVFNAKKKGKNGKLASLPPTGLDSSVPLKRSQSSISVMNSDKKEQGSGSRGKRILNALKSGNIRESMRFSNKKNRASSLTSVNSGSPFHGFQQISLVGRKDSGRDKSSARKRLLDTNEEGEKLDLTPLSRRSPAKQRQEADDQGNSMRLSHASLKTHSQKSPSTKSLQRSTNSNYTPESAALNNRGDSEEMGSKKKKRRRKAETDQSSAEVSKKKAKRSSGVMKAFEVWQNGASELPYMHDSSLEASKMFECIINPVKIDRFFSELWEKKPLLVKRHVPDYNKGWFSTAEFDRILRQENIQWGVNLDATTFVEDKRKTHNLSGRAFAPVVWDMYQVGCSLRLLNPQTYSRNVWKVLSILQEFFGCCVGANIYLTPPGTQGFAPHYDDIEAFIIQLEGKKHWRLYNPRTDDEVLPRFSSENFSQAEVGKPILDTVLEAGDLLYFPRGTIHQGNATDEHSLHITVSCYQLNTWGDLLMKMLPTAIQMAVQENSEFRVGLPRNYLNYMGIAHSEKDLPERDAFFEKTRSLMATLTASLPVDSSCDQMGKQLMHDSLPPVLSEREKLCSVHGAGERWDASMSRVVGVSEIKPDTEVKLLRKGVIRLLTEEDEVRVYYNIENARIYRAVGPNHFEITAEMAQCVEYLINAYPEYVTVESLPMEKLADQLNLVSILYEKGLVTTATPLETTYEEPGDDDFDTE